MCTRYMETQSLTLCMETVSNSVHGNKLELCTWKQSLTLLNLWFHEINETDIMLGRWYGNVLTADHLSPGFSYSKSKI